jgi:hypothetical protein
MYCCSFHFGTHSFLAILVKLSPGAIVYSFVLAEETSTFDEPLGSTVGSTFGGTVGSTLESTLGSTVG